MGKGGGKTQTTTQTSRPWAEAEPYLKDYLSSVSNWYNPNAQSVAGIAPEQQLAWGLGAQRALSGSPLTQAAEQAYLGSFGQQSPAMDLYSQFAKGGQVGQNPLYGLLGQTAAGGTMNPYLDQMYGTAAEQVGKSFRDITLPAISSRFGAAGRTGSGAEREMVERSMGQLGTTLGGLASDIYGRGFEAERGRQMQAAGMLGDVFGQEQAQRLGAIGGLGQTFQQGIGNTMGLIGMSPGLAQQQYFDIGQLSNIGAQRRGYEQQLLDAPFSQLQRYASLFAPISGYGTTTGTQPVSSSPIGSALGGGLAGYGVGGPWGAAVGAGAGLLSSYGY